MQVIDDDYISNLDKSNYQLYIDDLINATYTEVEQKKEGDFSKLLFISASCSLKLNYSKYMFYINSFLFL